MIFPIALLCGQPTGSLDKAGGDLCSEVGINAALVFSLFLSQIIELQLFYIRSSLLMFWLMKIKISLDT